MKFEKLFLSVILAGAVLLAGGCSSDKGTTTSPVPPGVDNAPPLAPTGLNAPDGKISVTGYLLTWEPSREADLSGYRVYRFDPDPQRTEAYVLVSGDSPIPLSSFPGQWDTPTPTWLRVSAVDASGNESGLSQPFLVTPGSNNESQTRGGRSSGPSEGSGPVPGPSSGGRDIGPRDGPRDPN
jgi:hypothetical protein